MQERRNPIANALELSLSCINPLIYPLSIQFDLIPEDGIYIEIGPLVVVSPGFKATWPRLNIKTAFPRYGDSHVKDKTVARPSYL